jgi:glycosyltransferase involved in cell wall biosynthesis
VIILQANKFFYEKGGSERYFFALSRELEARGHAVVPFAMAHPRNLPSPYSDYFVPLRTYDAREGSPRSLRAAAGFIRSRDAARRISRLVEAATPHIAHLHNIYHQLTPSIIDALADRGVPVVMTLHDYKLACPSYAMFARGAVCDRCLGGRYHHAVAVNCGGSRARSALLALEAWWQRRSRVYERVSRFIAPSEYLRDVMIRAGVAEQRIVHVSPLDPSAGAPAAGAADAAAHAARAPGVVAYVGRLSAEKGVAVLLRAASLVPEISLVIFGEGPEDSSLREMARRDRLANVRFAGHASRAELDQALECALAVVLPTLSPENAPMAILEAAHAGVPVIVSDRGGLPEMAARVGGCVVPAGDADRLAAALRDAGRDADRWRARARDAWHRNKAAYSAQAHIAAIEAVYRGVLSRRDGAR